jgi:hypothetical protein
MKWCWGPLCTKPTRLVGFFIVLAHWNNSLRIDMSPHSDTLSWFRANQSLLFLLNCCVLSGEATNTNFIVFGWPDRGSNPWPTAFEASKLDFLPYLWPICQTFVRVCCGVLSTTWSVCCIVICIWTTTKDRLSFQYNGGFTTKII